MFVIVRRDTRTVISITASPTTATAFVCDQVDDAADVQVGDVRTARGVYSRPSIEIAPPEVANDVATRIADLQRQIDELAAQVSS